MVLDENLNDHPKLSFHQQGSMDSWTKYQSTQLFQDISQKNKNKCLQSNGASGKVCASKWTERKWWVTKQFIVINRNVSKRLEKNWDFAVRHVYIECLYITDSQKWVFMSSYEGLGTDTYWCLSSSISQLSICISVPHGNSRTANPSFHLPATPYHYITWLA